MSVPRGRRQPCSAAQAQMADTRGKLADLRAAIGGFLDRYDEYVPAVAPDGGEAAMGGEEPYAYYGTARSAAPHWRNEVTRGSLHSLMTFDALGAADLLAATPLLVVHGETDDHCSPELAPRTLRAHARRQGDPLAGRPAAHRPL
jgi:fermentation-respiration switch protein FrsA (DUF1100 family)